MERQYELALLIKPILPEDVKSKVVKPIVEAAKKLKGSAEVAEDWGKRHLAYPIDANNSKDVYEEGYYLFMKVQLPSGVTKEFEKAVKLLERKDLLRYLFIREK